jgi:cell division septation protein DedD
MALQQVHQYGERGPRLGSAARRKRVRVWLVAGFFMGFVALAWAWAFQRAPGASAAGVPLLVADQQPTREKPADPGGMKVADIDPLAYDSGRSPPRVENLLPSPEKPLPQPAPDRQGVAAAPVAATNGVSPANEESSPTDTDSQQTQMADNATVGAPVKLVPDAPAPIAKQKPVAAKAAPAPRPPAVKPAPKPKLKPAAVIREDATPPARLVEAKARETGAKGYRLQLASLRSASDAQAMEARLRRSYGELLGSVGFSVVPVNLGDRGTYYRVMAGPMVQGAASRLCDTLRQRGAACLLAKP